MFPNSCGQTFLWPEVKMQTFSFFIKLFMWKSISIAKLATDRAKKKTLLYMRMGHCRNKRMVKNKTRISFCRLHSQKKKKN